jgi:hypothetical protein
MKTEKFESWNAIELKCSECDTPIWTFATKGDNEIIELVNSVGYPMAMCLECYFKIKGLSGAKL